MVGREIEGFEGQLMVGSGEFWGGRWVGERLRREKG